MKKFLAWLESKNITSHTVAVVCIGLATLLSTDEQVRDFFIREFQNHPKVLAWVFMLAGVIFKYTHSSKQPNPPEQK